MKFGGMIKLEKEFLVGDRVICDGVERPLKEVFIDE